MSKEGSTKIVNFMIPRAGSRDPVIVIVMIPWSYSEHAIFLLFLSTLGHGSDKLSNKAIMTKDGSAKIINFITIGAGVLR